MFFNRKDHSFSGIYLITNKVNGMVYVGQSKNLYKRFTSHKKSNGGRSISNAIREGGITNFHFSVLERVDEIKKLNSREQYWMDLYKSYDNNIGYNLCKYAFSTITHGEETRRILSEKMKDKFVGEKNPFYGKKHSDESRKKMSESGKVKFISDEHRKSMSIAAAGRKQSADHARKRMESMRKNGHFIMTEEKVKRLRLCNIGRTPWNKGVTHSEKTRSLLSKLGRERCKMDGYINPMKGKKRPDLAERNRLANKTTIKIKHGCTY